MNNEQFRKAVGEMFKSESFLFEVANEGKPPEKHTSDFASAALSVCKLYAVVEACEILVAINRFTRLMDALKGVISNDRWAFEIVNKCARLAWQAQQPMRGPSFIQRPIMGLTSANLPDDELQKDVVKMAAMAEFLLRKLEAATARLC
jgi:hypothetical protein